MSLFGKLRAHIQEHTASLELDDIQSTVLRIRPAPYNWSELLEVNRNEPLAPITA